MKAKIENKLKKEARENREAFIREINPVFCPGWRKRVTYLIEWGFLWGLMIIATLRIIGGFL